MDGNNLPFERAPGDGSDQLPQAIDAVRFLAKPWYLKDGMPVEPTLETGDVGLLSFPPGEIRCPLALVQNDRRNRNGVPVEYGHRSLGF